jgi:hypothetical protein
MLADIGEKTEINNIKCTGTVRNTEYETFCPII